MIKIKQVLFKYIYIKIGSKIDRRECQKEMREEGICVVCGGLLKMHVKPKYHFQQEKGGPIYMPIVLELSFNTMGPVFKGPVN